MFLEILQNSQENTCARVSFLIKLEASGLAQVFCCEFCEIYKNTFFTEHLLVTVSVDTSFEVSFLTISKKYSVLIRTPNDEIKTKRCWGESWGFFDAELKSPYQQI